MAMRKGNPFVENLVRGVTTPTTAGDFVIARRNDEATADYAFLLAIATLSLATVKVR